MYDLCSSVAQIRQVCISYALQLIVMKHSSKIHFKKLPQKILEAKLGVI